MGHPLWPLYDLRLRTGNLELRLPTELELAELIAVARAGIHPPDEMPFAIPWTDLPSPAFERSAYQFHLGTRANWRPDRWALVLGVWANGRLVGSQDLSAEGFPTRKTVHTGSWLGAEFQGQGIGKVMRQAVLALAFDHLGALAAESEAFVTNPASAAVSRAVGYEPNGRRIVAPRGEPIEAEGFRMTLEGWRARERPAVEVEGVEACLELFGAEMNLSP
jgi:RimJ/RimL family protein N-acetyltransferase